MFAFSGPTSAQPRWNKAMLSLKPKLKTARFFYNVLPEMEGHKAVVLAGKGPMMTFDDSEF